MQHCNIWFQWVLNYKADYSESHGIVCQNVILTEGEAWRESIMKSKSKDNWLKLEGEKTVKQKRLID